MRILGLSCFYHDSAAALLEDGGIVAAAQEERFSRRKHDARFPARAVRWCLSDSGIGMGDVDIIAYYESHALKRERQLAFRREESSDRPGTPRGENRAGASGSCAELLGPCFERAGLEFEAGKLREFGHHQSHAASAFYPSPYREAAVLVIDGVGEWDTLSVWHGSGDRLTRICGQRYPDSLGLLYAAFTDFCGFKVNSGEHKLMGLAPYGEPAFVDTIWDHIVSVNAEGFPVLNQEHFDCFRGRRMTTERFGRLFGIGARRPAQRITAKHADIAASIQRVLEDIVIGLAGYVRSRIDVPDLCMAGGVALNCVANARLLREGPFESIWIQPAAGDAGGAIGAACLAHVDAGLAGDSPNGRIGALRDVFLGPAYGPREIRSAIERSPHRELCSLEEVDAEGDGLARRAAADLAAGKVVGWFQGRMEFGPRALGARSILANPMLDNMQRDLNLKIKYRESFRPFSPIVLRERASEWFELEHESPYMLFVAPVRSEHRVASARGGRGLSRINERRSRIPAVTHVDYSARVQTVDRDRDPRMHALLGEFERRTGCPVLVNTSFNVRGEPIVCSPDDAIRCFGGTCMDVLYLGGFRLAKRSVQQPMDPGFARSFALD